MGRGVESQIPLVSVIFIYYLPVYELEINTLEYLNHMLKQDFRRSKVMDKEEMIDYCYKLLERYKKEKTKAISVFNTKYTSYTNVAQYNYIILKKWRWEVIIFLYFPVFIHLSASYYPN